VVRLAPWPLPVFFTMTRPGSLGRVAPERSQGPAISLAGLRSAQFSRTEGRRGVSFAAPVGEAKSRRTGGFCQRSFFDLFVFRFGRRRAGNLWIS